VVASAWSGRQGSVQAARSSHLRLGSMRPSRASLPACVAMPRAALPPNASARAMMQDRLLIHDVSIIRQSTLASL
jgi:hypothetical protein